MSDLISRSELMKELNKYCGNQRYLVSENIREIINNQPNAYSVEKVVEELEMEMKASSGYSAERVSAFSRAIEIVKQEAEQYNNGWIPCSERLPKYGEVVMCSCTNSGITISCITHKGVKPSKSVRFGQHSVIAWQPLPLPYHPKGE